MQVFSAKCGLIVAALILSPAHAGTMPPEQVRGPIRVIDGDTVRLTSGETIRIYNIDAPETRKSRCAKEKWAGETATAYLGRLLDAGGVTISRCEIGTGRCKDRYGRTLATMATKNVTDVGDAMVGMGLALPWQSGEAAHDARAHYWCHEFGEELD